jgi:Uncharacterized protein conserved in bacteria (DUF2147)
LANETTNHAPSPALYKYVDMAGQASSSGEAGENVGRRQEEPGAGIAAASVVWLDHPVGLRPTGPDRWTDGWFYNPDDGDTYNISAELRSADTIDARIYLGDPLLGRTKTLHRVPHGTSNG